MTKQKRAVLVEGRGRNRRTGRTISFRIFKPRNRGCFDSGIKDHRANQKIIRALRNKLEIEEVRHYIVPTVVPRELESHIDLPSYEYSLSRGGIGLPDVFHPCFPLDPMRVGRAIEQGDWKVLEFNLDRRENPNGVFTPRHSALVRIGNETVLLRNGDDFLATREIRTSVGIYDESFKWIFIGRGLSRAVWIVPNKDDPRSAIRSILYIISISVSRVGLFDDEIPRLRFHPKQA